MVLESKGDGPAIQIPRANVTGISVQCGYRRQTLKGAVVGIGIGVVGGILLGQPSDTFYNTAVAVGTSVGVGLLTGSLVGWFVRSPEWDGVDMSTFGNGCY